VKRILDIDPKGAMPIWRQIEDGVRRLVASGGLERGTRVPSVREMAKALRVNPATVAKAYARLTDAGVLEMKRGEGTFVSERPPKLAAAERRRLLDEGAARFVAQAATLGAGEEEIREVVEKRLRDLKQNGGKP